jgi:hypothetical protein
VQEFQGSLMIQFCREMNGSRKAVALRIGGKSKEKHAGRQSDKMPGCRTISP